VKREFLRLSGSAGWHPVARSREVNSGRFSLIGRRIADNSGPSAEMGRIALGNVMATLGAGSRSGASVTDVVPAVKVGLSCQRPGRTQLDHLHTSSLMRLDRQRIAITFPRRIRHWQPGSIDIS